MHDDLIERNLDTVTVKQEFHLFIQIAGDLIFFQFVSPGIHPNDD